MTTEEIVKKLLEYIKNGQNVQAEEELYADDVLSVEQNGYSVKGKENVIAKTKAAMAGVQEFHGGGVSAAYVGADSFLLRYEMDMTPVGGERMQMIEYGFCKLVDGKVSEEYYFAQPLPLN
jgi:hypothetical protein